MSNYLTFLLTMLAQDKRLPGFQGLMISPRGSVEVVYRYGLAPFTSLEALHLWCITLKPFSGASVSSGKPTEPIS